jgi:two-component system, chemotaxis family, chemotaxis protein CheY
MTTILIIDDSKLARSMVSNMVAFLRPDWTVETVNNADEALARVADLTPDMAVIDYNRPGMDGLTLATVLRGRFPAMTISILTANVQDSTRRKVANLGFGFIDKPITTDKLRDALAAMAIRP